MASTNQQNDESVTEPSQFPAADQIALPPDDELDFPVESNQSQEPTIDPNLEVVTLYDEYDLTVVVGRAWSHRYGSKAFRVSRAAMRNASTVWKEMIDGDGTKGKIFIIKFPDDKPRDFHLVLQIAHLQISDLPQWVHMPAMLELAVLTEKYELRDIVGLFAESKGWIVNLKGKEPEMRMADEVLPRSAYIAKVFGFGEDYQYHFNRLVMAAKIDSVDESMHFSERWDECTMAFKLSDVIMDEIREARLKVFRDWVECYNTAMKEAAENDIIPCGDIACPVVQLDLLMKAFEAALSPAAGEKPKLIPLTIHYYWKCIEKLSKRYNSDAPLRVPGSGNTDEASKCEHKCFGDFEVIDKLRETLKSHVHETLWSRWEHNARM